MGQFNPFIGSSSSGIKPEEIVKELKFDEQGNLIVTYANETEVSLGQSFITDSLDKQKYKIGIENKKVYVEEVETENG